MVNLRTSDLVFSPKIMGSGSTRIQNFGRNRIRNQRVPDPGPFLFRKMDANMTIKAWQKRYFFHSSNQFLCIQSSLLLKKNYVKKCLKKFLKKSYIKKNAGPGNGVFFGKQDPDPDTDPDPDPELIKKRIRSRIRNNFFPDPQHYS
jgi:hypothetical protein